MKTLKPAHPGKILREEFIEPLHLTQYRVAKDAGISHASMSAIINGKRPVTVETALRLSRYFGTTPQFWLNLQSDYDLRLARREKIAERIEREVKPLEVIAA